MTSKPVNPYSFALVVDAIRIVQSDSSHSGEDEPLAYDQHTKSYLVEKIRGTTIYPFEDCNNVVFDKLTSAGLQLYLYILLNLKWEKDYINLKSIETCEILNISRVTLYKAIKQLESINVICKKSRSEYWINPKYLFNGSVVKYASKQENSEVNIVKIINKSNK